MCARKKIPFEFQNRQDFKGKLSEWIGDVLYDILPEQGLEERDEQIFTAFQIADAMCDGKVHMAEAGLGTGKTFAYLLSAIPYARFTGKPVVIACATPALQEQLAGSTGDIETLSRLLGLQVDARMAKDSSQYICDIRATENADGLGKDSDKVQQWLLTTTLGERSEIPEISDRIWKQICWNEYVACDTCSSRGYCRLVEARKYYREAADLIIVDHATFFHDLWTREERIADGKLSILPDYSAVVFDEGHKVLLPAAMQAGNPVIREEIDSMIQCLEEIQDARPSLVKATVSLEKASNAFFKVLKASVIAGESSERLSIRRTETLLRVAAAFRQSMDHVLLELQIEQELYIESLTPTQIQAFEGQMERATAALARFCGKDRAEFIAWVDKKDGTFWVVPRKISEMLDKQLYQKNIPVVFASATLSNKGNFDYFARTVGVKEPSKSFVGSSFEFEKQAVIVLSEPSDKENEFSEKIQKMVSLLQENEGRTLVLVNSTEEVKRIRKALADYEFAFEILWEDKGERGYLVQRFREEETSVLVGVDFWEGIDVPGEALTLLVVWQLPFPKLDPLLEVQRKEAKEQGQDPVITVDYPDMGLKLKQGCGRLIRTRTDHGKIVVLDRVTGTPWEQTVINALPAGASIERKKIEIRI